MDSLLNHTRLSTRVRIEEVPHRPADNQTAEIEEVGKRFEAADSAICVGSPNASDLATLTLGKMFGLANPFASTPMVSDPRELPLPFYFVFSRGSGNGHEADHRTQFAVNTEQLAGWTLPDTDLVDQIEHGKAQAMIINGQVLPARYNSREERRDYGIVAIQRRSKTALSVVIAGLSGPGTYAAASVFCDMADEIRARDGAFPTFYAVVEATVKRNPRLNVGDDREAGEFRLLGTPSSWPPP